MLASRNPAAPESTFLASTLAALILLAGCLLPATSQSAEDIELPELGETGAGLMTPAREEALGQAWLRAFRASVPLNSDPLLYDYVENLLQKLASYSDLKDKQLSLVVVENPTINAFAVPGGVIGVHSGLFLHAETEAQMASVLAHELAHLSQRHFARGVEAAKRSQFVSLAGLLAGVVLAATSEGDGAQAAIISSQAAAVDSQLRYSRMHEREADREGLKTLVAAGYPADAVADMFRQMLDASRLYGNQIPEFLLTHPVTESRVADASSRALQLQESGESERDALDIDYALMRYRTEVLTSTSLDDRITEYQHRLSNSNDSDNKPGVQQQAARYGLALALGQKQRYSEAKHTLTPLLSELPVRLPYALLAAEIDFALGERQAALQQLRELHALMPDNYPVGMSLANKLNNIGDYHQAANILEDLADRWPEQSDIWYLLAEVYGLDGKIVELHQARAEFFTLRANFSQARKQLQYALEISKDNYVTSARIKQRIYEISALELEQRKL